MKNRSDDTKICVHILDVDKTTLTQTKGAKMTTLALQILSYVTILPALAFIALAFWAKA